MSGDMLTEVRFWSQVIGESRRTVLCPPDLESRCKGYVDARGLGGVITVIPSPHIPDNQILVVGESAAPFATALRWSECARGEHCQWILCPVHAPTTDPA